MLRLTADYSAADASLTVRVKQSCPPTPGQPVKEPHHIPLALGLLGPDGADLPLQLEGEGAPHAATTRVLSVTEAEQTFRFVNLPAKPVVSALRGFSAPVRLHVLRGYDELAFLLRHDSDAFNRWDAGQVLASQIMLNLVEQIIEGEQPKKADPHLVEAYRHLLAQPWEDLSFLSLLLGLPSEDYIGSLMKIIDPDAIHAARQLLKKEIATALADDFRRLYAEHHRDESGRFDAQAIGRRRLKNVCLGYLAELDTDDTHRLCAEQFHQARNMTDQIAALGCLVNSSAAAKGACLAEFYEQWREEALVVDKWFALQAGCHLPGTLDVARELLSHPAFDLKNPNRVRSLVGAFSQSNPVRFHALDGSGYDFLAEQVIALNALNPQIAARLLAPLSQWRRLDEARQRAMTAALKRIMAEPGVSKDVYEVASKSLG
ncbi:DUF3458 domain-containing protein [Methylogaea oryzae]|uniref:DUF3458 domain-containing protein n=1 Tax=Methylogaea oryzae TaxID=1295382 RepID=UPI000AAE213D